MAKPIINYKGYMTENPADRTGPKICIPQIVDRNQVLDLSEVIEKAIDRGLIAGLKSSAAKSIADGIMLQLGETLNSGTGVIFGEYFSVRPYLTGTIADLLAPLTAQNLLRVRFVPGSAYKLNGKDFSFHNVTQTEDVPEILFTQPDVNGAPVGTWSGDVPTQVIGKNLLLDAGDKVEVYNCSGATPVKKFTYPQESFASQNIGNNESSIYFPADLVSEWAAELGEGKAGFKVVRTVTVEGVETTIESKMYVADHYVLEV